MQQIQLAILAVYCIILDQHIRNSIMCTYRDQFIQIWHASLEREQSLTGQGGNKLRSYRLFKKDFVLEPYLLNITSTALRVSMTRLRVGCHSLEIERGRHHKAHSVPVSQRLCYQCKSVEDEIHFLCECTRHNKQRDNLEHIILNMYPGYKWLTSKQEFVYLLESTNKKINYAVAHFIYMALFCT